MVILETQQNSDVTYRVYDYDRLSGGKPRELHIGQSIDVIRVPAAAPEDSVIPLAQDGRKNELCRLYSCAYYTVFRMELEGAAEFEQSYPFLNMTVTQGSGMIDGQPVYQGDHMILPNGYGKVALQGEMEIVASTVI